MPATEPPHPADAPALHLDRQHAVITLRRMLQHNRIDPDDVTVIGRHLDRIQEQTDVRVLVITGSGAKTFCSGYTIQAIRSHLDGGFEQLLDRIETFRIPTVCALNGSVYGGGIDLALCCDFRIGVVGSRMRMPAATFGLHYYPGGLRRFVTRIGMAEKVEAYVSAMCQGSATAIQSMKQQINQLAGGTWNEADGRRSFLESLHSAELAERLSRSTAAH